MRLGHPEIIKHWLRDPRAAQFGDYPKVLLAWESTSLPDEIYYGPLVNGAVPVGVCAIDAELLQHCSANDLQELIDRKSQRLHNVLCERELDKTRDELRLHLEKCEADPWPEALRLMVHGLRFAAFFHFPGPEDFFVKVVTSPFQNIPEERWSGPKRVGDRTRWVTWRGHLSHEDIDLII